MAYQRIITWVDACAIEVCGLGRILHFPNENRYHIASTYLPEQISSGAETEATPLGIARIEHDSRNDPGHMNFRWHSHVNMPAFWSGTDITCIKSTGAEWFTLHLVINKKREYRCALYFPPADIRPEIFLDELQLSITPLIPLETRDAWRAELLAKSKQKTLPSKNFPRQTHDGMHDYNLASDIPDARNDALDDVFDKALENIEASKSLKACKQARSHALKLIRKTAMQPDVREFFRDAIEQKFQDWRKTWNQ